MFAFAEASKYVELTAHVSELSYVVEKIVFEIARRQFNRACEAEKVEVKNWSRAF
jgi:hypothetical protein